MAGLLRFRTPTPLRILRSLGRRSRRSIGRLVSRGGSRSVGWLVRRRSRGRCVRRLIGGRSHRSALLRGRAGFGSSQAFARGRGRRRGGRLSRAAGGKQRESKGERKSCPRHLSVLLKWVLRMAPQEPLKRRSLSSVPHGLRRRDFRLPSLFGHQNAMARARIRSRHRPPS
jgi:hypothetical protein